MNKLPALQPSPIHERTDRGPRPGPSTARLLDLGYPTCPGGEVAMPPSARLWSVQSLEEQFAALRAMTPRQRVAAMYSGQLTIQQLSKWAAMAPDEVAVIDGEFIYIVAELADYDAAPRTTATSTVSRHA